FIVLSFPFSIHLHYTLAILSTQELRTYKHATQFAYWVKAMDVGVYKIKCRDDDNIERYKACLVAKGFTQTKGIYYFDKISPMAKLTTICFY
ncbi:hypothetical protein CR513_46203, partial [Mucuna pruriens]